MTDLTHRLGVGLTAAAMATAMLVSGASPAQAHAALVSSDPEAGARLAAAPGVVRVRFSEPLIVDLSTITVIDPTGRSWPRSVASEQMMSVSLDTTAQGVYTVEWTTVSPLDGHTLRGEFRFGVGVSPGEAEETVPGPQSSDLLLGVARAVEDAALLIVVGSLVVGAVGRRAPALTWVQIQPTLYWTAVTALAGGMAVVVGEALVASPQPSVGSVSTYLGTAPGLHRLFRLAAEVAMLVGAARSRRLVAAAGALLALGALAAAGHAAAVTPRWWGVGVGTIHLAAAGIWAGGIGTMALLRPPGGWRGEAALDLLRRFSPPAIAAFLTTALFGGLRALQELSTPNDLVATSYGRVLLVKIAAVALMVPLSWRAWRRRRTHPRFESTLGLVAVLAAALLAAYPLPPGRAAEAEAVAEGSRAAFPQAGDLTLASNAGETLVGLTLRPGLPGENEALVYVLPPGGEEAAVGLNTQIQIGESPPTSMQRCGTACRTTTLTLDGGETITIAVEGVDDPATFRLPRLPTPDGSPLLDLLTERMSELTSLRYQEVLGPADPPVTSTVEMVAPDRIRVIIGSGTEQIRIGDSFYRRDSPGEAWQVTPGTTVTVPAFVWDYPNKAGVHVVAGEEISGTPTRVVAFFVNVGDNLPIWYRLWVDDTGLVHRAEMRAEGHFMDHTYSGFDTPISIIAPTG